MIAPENRAKVIGGCCCAWDDFPHFERTIPPAILLFADRLWNASVPPVAYDDAYGAAMTHVLFEGKLPQGMNVFRAVGDVLPPLKNEAPVHFKYVQADLAEIREIKEALSALADKGDALAAVYAGMVKAAEDHVASLPAIAGPLKETVKFDG